MEWKVQKKKNLFICHIHNYTQYNAQWNSLSAFNPYYSQLTVLGAVGCHGAAPGEQSGVKGLAQGPNSGRAVGIQR